MAIEFADASDRRDAMKTFMNEAPAEAVAEQTPTEADEVENVEDLLETPEPKRTPVEEAVGEGDEEEVIEPVEADEDEAEEEEAAEPGEGDEEEEAEEAEAEEERDWRTPLDEVEPEQLAVLQDRNEAFEGLVEALDNTDYAIDFGKTPEQLAAGMQEVGLRLGDAHALYSIMEGKGADGIFERLKKFQGQEAHDFALNEVLKYAAKVGLIESADGAAAAAKDGGTGAAAASATETPNEKRLRLENERLKKDAKTKEVSTQATAAAQRQKAIFDSAMNHVKEIADAAKLDEGTLMDFVVPYIIRKVGGQKPIINRIARGNFVDIQQFYDEAMNTINGRRVAAGNKKVQQRQIRDRKVPKRVAGEDKTTRTPAARQAADLSTSDGRRAAAKASLRG
jgi:hypothetical protein